MISDSSMMKLLCNKIDILKPKKFKIMNKIIANNK